LSPRLREVSTPRILDRARVLGAAMLVRRGKLVLRLPGKLSKLSSDRLFSRLRQLARLIGREPAIES
jgi:exopolyphosphatase/guanosine-5'-triphosphate,3'-diphosphate pyrophosphatase